MTAKKGNNGTARSSKGPKTDPVINYTIEPDSRSGHRMVINIVPPDGIKRVETAFISPSGSVGLQHARKVEDSTYESVIHSRESGEFRVSIAAFGRKILHGLLDTKYTVVLPDGSRGFAKGKSSSASLDIPPPPSEIRKRRIQTFPISSAYAKALQNLNFSIAQSYPDLKVGKLQTNPNVGFKSYIFGSGNFGVVFKMDIKGKLQALKCFTRAAPDIAERYYYLSSYLSKVSLPFLVDFHYLSKAIRVISKPKDYYPALVMDWVEGQNVNQFIEKNLSKPVVIEKFASNFIRAVGMMQMAGIAHGDLSGDNIIVNDSGDVTFIDYDGMFIPNLAGRNPPEKGHENFQHPLREKEYSEKLDNFSALVIYISALAVAEDRSIWRFNKKDMDRLIFTGEDFRNPKKSKVVERLLGMSERVQRLTVLMGEYLGRDPLWDGASPSIIMNQ